MAKGEPLRVLVDQVTPVSFLSPISLPWSSEMTLTYPHFVG